MSELTAPAATTAELERRVRSALRRRLQLARTEDHEQWDGECAAQIMEAVDAHLALTGAECRALRDVVVPGLHAAGHGAEAGERSCWCGASLGDDGEAAYGAHALEMVARAMTLLAAEHAAGSAEQPTGDGAGNLESERGLAATTGTARSRAKRPAKAT